MKKIIFILSLFICSYSFGQAFIDSAGGLEPSGAFAGYYSKYIQGSSKVVYDTTARNSIPSYFRDTTTFLCYTIKDSSLWRLSGGISNSNFVRISQLSQSGYGVNAIKNGGNSFVGSASIGTNDSNFVYLKTNGINRWSISPFDGRLTYGATSLRGDDYGSITTGQGYFARVSATDYISFPSDTIAHSGYNDVISFQNGVPYYNSGGVWHAFLNDSTLFYSAGYGLNLSPTGQFKVDTGKILPKNDSGYLYVTPTQLALKVNKSDSSLRTGYVTPTVLTNDSITLANQTATKEPIISPSNTIKQYWNGYKQFVNFNTDSIPQGSTNKYFVTSDTAGLSNKLNKSNFIDSLTGRNATLLGNTTTGSGGTIVLSGSPTLTLPNIAAINVSGGILSFPTGGSGTVALRGDTTARYTGLATLGKTYNDSLVLNRTAGIDVTITNNAVNADTTTGATKLATQGYVGRNSITLSSLSATRNVSTGSIFTYSIATGAYNFDTTKLAPTLSANAPISIVSNVINADTTTRFTGLASLGKAYNDSLTLATAINGKGVGTITGVTAGIDLTGGGTSGSVTLNADTTTGATKLATQGYVTRNAGGVSLSGNNTWTGVQTFKSTVTASGGVSKGTLITDSTIAAANNDTLVGLDVLPTFNINSKTGVTKSALRYGNGFLCENGASIPSGAGSTDIILKYGTKIQETYNGGTVNYLQVGGSGNNLILGTSIGSVQMAVGSATYNFSSVAANFPGTIGGYPSGVSYTGINPYGTTASMNIFNGYYNLLVPTSGAVSFSTSPSSTNGYVEAGRFDQKGQFLLNTTTNDGVNQLQVNGSAKATSFNSNAAVTDLTTGSNTITAGHIYFSMPFQGSVTNGGYKKVMIYLNGLSNTTTTITYSSSGGVAFTNTPYVYGTAGAVALVTATSTTVTIAAATTATGYIFLEGN